MSDEHEALLIDLLSRDMVARTAAAGLTPGSGCACLALAYARWVEQQPDSTADDLLAMLEVSRTTARAAFDLMRDVRAERARLVAAAVAAMMSEVSDHGL